jgi:phosphate transport system ATP-binding protein
MLVDDPPAATALQVAQRTEKLSVRNDSNEILKALSIDIRRGEILSIIGPAGAGKTTFLRCLNRMNDFEPELKISGQVYLDGEPIYAPEMDVALLRRKVGMVFSVPNPLPMSIFENVAFGLDVAGLPRAHQVTRVEEALNEASLWDEVKDRLKEPARNLSGGQQQRLCLARSLALKPDVLLLDEPCSGLDPISTARIEDALHVLKQNLAVLLVTNNVKQASRTSDRTAFFLFGEVIELQSTAVLFTNPADQRTADYISGRFG